MRAGTWKFSTFAPRRIPIRLRSRGWTPTWLGSSVRTICCSARCFCELLTTESSGISAITTAWSTGTASRSSSPTSPSGTTIRTSRLRRRCGRSMRWWRPIWNTGTLRGFCSTVSTGSNELNQDRKRRGFCMGRWMTSLSPISAHVEVDGAAQLYRYAADAGIRRTRLPMAALIAYIARTTGQHDVVVSVPMAARVGRDMRRTPSMASTILPLGIRVERSETIGQLATRLDTALISILKHGRYRGEDLARDVRAIDPDRQVFGPGINSMMFEHTLTFGGCPVRVRNSVTGRVSDLDLSVRGGQDGEPIEIDVRAPAGFDGSWPITPPESNSSSIDSWPSRSFRSRHSTPCRARSVNSCSTGGTTPQNRSP